jgi:hypothetical protein
MMMDASVGAFLDRACRCRRPPPLPLHTEPGRIRMRKREGSACSSTRLRASARNDQVTSLPLSPPRSSCTTQGSSWGYLKVNSAPWGSAPPLDAPPALRAFPGAQARSE